MKTKAILAALLVFSQTSLAQIGADKSMIDSFVARHNAHRLNIEKHDQYDIHNVQMAHNRIRFYVSKENKIFCQSWSGRIHPDLTEALGPYLNEYHEAAVKMRKKGMRQLAVKTKNISVSVHGMMGALKGRACVNGNMPNNVSFEDIN